VPASGDIVVFGEVLFDRYEDGSRVLGGAPFNVAWHLCGFGRAPLVVSAVGDDPDGQEVLDRMEGWGLATHGVQTDGRHPTGRVEVTTENGSPSYAIVPDQAWDHLDPAAAARVIPAGGVALVYHGSLALRSEETRQALERVLETADAPVFVDVNLRDPWWTEERVSRALDRAHYAKLNDEEVWALVERGDAGEDGPRHPGGGGGDGPAETAGDDPEAAGSRREEDDAPAAALVRAARMLRERHGLRELVVTRGSRGAFLVDDEDALVSVDAPDVPDLVDTVGAGDAFSSVLCLGMVAGWDRETTLLRATDLAAEVCRQQGATDTDLSVYDQHLRSWAELPRRRPGIHADRGLRILSLSVHGLIRGREIELGRDADTGGQVSYVVDQARALAGHPDVEQVHLVTRLVEDRNVDASYAEPREELAPGATLVRLPFGPRRYLHKESLWPYLDSLLDELTHWARDQEQLPDVIHGHYADAGYVGAQISKLLGIPFVFTGHSLGRIKKARLLARGRTPEQLEERYNIRRRIEAEEQALEAADLVITSTRHEVQEQYEGYDHYVPSRMEIIPPGVDLTRFSPPSRFWVEPPFAAELRRFLDDPAKPMVLALARPDERKNFLTLVQAYAETPGLRDKANLVLIAGNRDDIAELPAPQRRVLQEILVAIDRYDLYGRVAYPKHHDTEDVPEIYRLAARSRGVFVNPALTEPFGLTLIEAAAVGLPVVATNDGGPRDILEACRHGVLVDPMDAEEMGEAILRSVSEPVTWARRSKSAVSRVHSSFSWQSHARRYVEAVDEVLSGTRPNPVHHRPSRLPLVDRVLLTDMDETLTGDMEALAELTDRIHRARDVAAFGIVTGRTLDKALAVLDDLGLWVPDILITASGTELYYGTRLVRDRSWERQILHRWDPEAVRAALDEVPGMVLAPDEDQTHLRIRYLWDPDEAPDVAALRTRLRQAGLQANPMLDRQTHLDITPGRATPGLAIRFLCFKWNLPPERLLVAGDSGNDADMLSGETLGVVVGNHTAELDDLRGHPRVRFVEGRHAAGILDGIEHYDFFGTIRPGSPDDA
jgi:sucrose-phosphate synthase